MGGMIVTTTTAVSAAQGVNYGVGKATDKYGNTIDVYNLSADAIQVGRRCLVMHAAGGQYHIARVED